MIKNFITAILLTLGSFALSQNYFKAEYVKVKELDANGKVKFASFKSTANISLEESNSLLTEALGLNNLNKLVQEKAEDDIFGAHHIHYKQFYNGIEVAYNHYTLHAKNGIVTSINGTFTEIELPVNLSALKTPEQIYQIGLGNLGNDYSQLPDEFQGVTPISKLVVLPKYTSNAGENRYAYQFSLVSVEKGSIEKVFLDALTGEVLKKENLLKTHTKKQTVFTEEQVAYLNKIKDLNQSRNSFANLTLDAGNAETRYSGLREIETISTDTGYVLHAETRFLKTKNFENNDYLVIALLLAFGSTPEDVEAVASDYVDADNNWTAEEYAATKDDGALEAHWGFSQAYDFFKNEYNREGFDNANSNVTSFIHTTFFGEPSNAAWLSLSSLNPEWTGGYMFVGDGNYDPVTGTGNWDILAPMDVISHEFAHGVDAAAGDLMYERESGAMDEGFADIWGATIEAKQAPEKQKWIIGEDFVMVEPDGIRSLQEPKIFNQPNTYFGEFWIDTTPEGCPTPDQDNDQCGVHTNSGVLNYWYYLISDGGNGTNDNGFAYDVTGMGIEKAADLVYSTQINYIQPQSQFADVRNYTIQEAEVLYGEDSPEVTSVKDAWCAVGVTTGEDCGEIMGTQDLTENELSIYPNPVSDILNVNSSKDSQNITYEIHNMAGQILQQGNLNNNKINVSILPKGVYILMLKKINHTQKIKFIKK